MKLDLAFVRTDVGMFRKMYAFEYIDRNIRRKCLYLWVCIVLGTCGCTISKNNYYRVAAVLVCDEWGSKNGNRGSIFH